MEDRLSASPAPTTPTPALPQREDILFRCARLVALVAAKKSKTPRIRATVHKPLVHCVPRTTHYAPPCQPPARPYPRGGALLHRNRTKGFLSWRNKRTTGHQPRATSRFLQATSYYSYRLQAVLSPRAAHYVLLTALPTPTPTLHRGRASSYDAARHQASCCSE